jgi:hypothetical protein
MLGAVFVEGRVQAGLAQKHPSACRADLDAFAPRTLAVLRPLRIVITNLSPDHEEEVEGKVCSCGVPVAREHELDTNPNPNPDPLPMLTYKFKNEKQKKQKKMLRHFH